MLFHLKLLIIIIVFNIKFNVLSNKIRTDLMSKHDNEAITSYNVLYELGIAMTNAPCKHFVSYLHKLINYWNCLLQRHYSE